MAIDFYTSPTIRTCRLVSLAAKQFGLQLNPKQINLSDKEQLKPEFLALNPQHKIPTIVDNGFALGESRAIVQYFARKVNSPLYPTDNQDLAKVEQLLYFDTALNQTVYEYSRSLNDEQPNEEKHNAFKNNLNVLNTFLDAHSFVASNAITIADMAIAVTLSTLDVHRNYDFSEWNRVKDWLSRVKQELTHYHECIEVPLIEAIKTN